MEKVSCRHMIKISGSTIGSVLRVICRFNVVILLMCFVFFSSITSIANKPVRGDKNEPIIKVPEDFLTIAEAIEQSKNGDVIIISPGMYYENNIEINKSITVSSEWKLTGEESKINETTIDAGDSILFTINASGVEISGLTMINGDHTLNVLNKVTVMHNHLVGNLDAISMESGSGGYIGHNTIENDRDDGIDVDIVANKNNTGSDLVVEHNLITNSNDDGIELRLFSYPNQNISYTFSENTIIGSNNAGIQLISYDVYTGKKLHIHHNIFSKCKVGLGCMEGSRTKEDLSGASKMDELVYFYNNTLVENKIGATGGNSIIAVNNLVVNNSLGGFKRFGKNSVIANNLFYQNGNNNFIEINDSVFNSNNIVYKDPLLTENTFVPAKNSPCIDAGVESFEFDGNLHLYVQSEYKCGTAPDIGAIEKGRKNSFTSSGSLLVDAGEDQIVISPEKELMLKGKIISGGNKSVKCNWEMVEGPSSIKLSHPNKKETSVKFSVQGIYKFKLTCAGENAIASDDVKVRYVNDGLGKQLFLDEKDTHVIEIENYAYSYGEIEEVNDAENIENKYISLEGGTEPSSSLLEFSIGMAESNEYEMWLLIKSPNSGENKIRIEFNNKKIAEVRVNQSDNLYWIKLPQKVLTKPGQWQLLINNPSGKIVLDKIILTKNQSFHPE
uniref:right-handed parallel beta-helix repeat-containing protein n=1 Tax=uncultured Draconibacterium sp. TaxID=1573823 RepID=UPI003217F2DE